MAFAFHHPRFQSISSGLCAVKKQEAEAALAQFLDRAVLANLTQITVIHGKGTGAVRKAVHAYLKRCKSVASFRLGRYGEGETGVTVVELK